MVFPDKRREIIKEWIDSGYIILPNGRRVKGIL